MWLRFVARVAAAPVRTDQPADSLGNPAPLALYVDYGFQVQGLRRATIDRVGLAANEYCMGLLLEGGTQVAQ